MSEQNKLSRIIGKFDIFPAVLRQRLVSFTVGQIVPFVGTAGLKIEEMTTERVVVSVANRRRIQNHIKGLHAAVMALLAETASGFIVGMNLPDDKLPLIKTLKVDFKKRSKGAMRICATLTDEQRQKMVAEERGDVLVPLEIQDESGASPIQCEMLWAWVPKG